MLESHEHITCKEVVELVTDYLETALPTDETELFEQHLNFCEGCVWYLHEVRTTVQQVGALREEDVPSDTKERLMAAFRDWKRGKT